VTTRSASRIDEQILAIWHALRVNPSLDARWAMQVIDRLLDERPRPGQLPPPVTPPSPQAGSPPGPQAGSPPGPQAGSPAAVALPGLVPGSPGQQAILASVIRALLAGEPG
jgi:hypothetical protein